MKYQGAGSERLVHIACVLALAACVPVLPRCVPSALAAGLTRGPYLQRLTSDSVTVVWNTNVAAECAVQIRPLGSQPTVVGGLTDTVCVVAVDGLAPGTVYAYTPLADGVPLLAAAGFRTPRVALPYTFLVFGDSGSGNQDQLAVRDSMLNSPADFIVHTGDMSYPEAAPGQWNPKYFTPYRDLLSKLVLWPSLGNHDVRNDDGASWRDVFHTPANNPAGSEDYYSFDYGNSHFVVLDSNRSLKPGSAQHTFLNQDLAASTATWKFVVFHHTIYSSGYHGSNLSIRQYLVPVFDAYRVDVVFMGHDHDYERTKPLVGDQVVAPGEGTLYVTTGGGGGELRPMASSSFTAYSESVLHFVRVSVAGESLRLEMVRADGSIGDSLVLAKGAAGECGDGHVNQVG
jgi:predicted phosphodiesterase